MLRIFACRRIEVSKVLGRVAQGAELVPSQFTDEFTNQREVVVVLFVRLAALGVKQVVAGHEFEEHAGERPHVCTLVVRAAKNDFRRAVLTRLNQVRVVPVYIACVTHVANLYAKLKLPQPLYFFTRSQHQFTMRPPH